MTKLFTSLFLVLLLSSCKQQTQYVFAPEYLHPEKGMQVITSLINNKDSTIALLYGNEQALQYARANEKVHRAAEKYVLVTAHLRPMPRWYGTNMNGSIMRIEQVTVHAQESGGLSYAYSQQNRAGASELSAVEQATRIRWITDQPAAVYP